MPSHFCRFSSLSGNPVNLSFWNQLCQKPSWLSVYGSSQYWQKAPYRSTVTRPLTKPKNSLQTKRTDTSTNLITRITHVLSPWYHFPDAFKHPSLMKHFSVTSIATIHHSWRISWYRVALILHHIRTYLCTAIFHDHESPTFTAKCPTNWTDIDEILISSRRPNRSYGKIQ